LLEISQVLSKALKLTMSVNKMQFYAQTAAQLIRRRTRVGYGVDTLGGNIKPLKPLSEGYKADRRIDRALGQLSKDTAPAKSNLTRTGQMLDAINGRGVREGIGEVYFEENRNDGEFNAEIAFENEQRGRKFFTLSGAEINELERIVRRQYTNNIDKIFKGLT